MHQVYGVFRRLSKPWELFYNTLVVALASGEDSQLARVPAGELLTHLGVAALPGRCAVQIEDRLRVRIDEFRRFKCLNTVVRSAGIVVAGR